MAPEIIIHRVNTRDKLAMVPSRFGLEIDLRADGKEIVLNHDPFKGGERFVDWLKDFHHGTLVLNIKEAGIEETVLQMASDAGVSRMFLLDVEFPYIFRATRKGESRIAMRYSEDEALDTALRYAGKADWLWIDTITKLPLEPSILIQINSFKTCLVCPERWGRPLQIQEYKERMNSLGFSPNAVMTSLECAGIWEGKIV